MHFVRYPHPLGAGQLTLNTKKVSCNDYSNRKKQHSFEEALMYLGKSNTEYVFDRHIADLPILDGSLTSDVEGWVIQLEKN